MSWRVANTCAERKFGSATRKQIIMFLADKASDDGSGIWCSTGTIQRHTELGETTVKRTVREFLKEGILVETGARTCKNGFTVVYRIDLTKVEALEPTHEPEIETGSTVAPVQTDRGAGATTAPEPSINHLRASARRRRLKRLRRFWRRIHRIDCAAKRPVLPRLTRPRRKGSGRKTCGRRSKPTRPTAQVSPAPRSAFPTTGFSRSAGKDTLRIFAPSERKPKMQP